MPSLPRYTIVGLGELLWDIFPDGSRRLGGAPANVAYHAAALGDRGVIASRVGQDSAGDEALAALARRGVDVSLVQRDAALPTGEARIHRCVTGGEQPHFAVEMEAAWSVPRWSAEWERALAGAHLLCFGTLLCARPAGLEVVERAVAALPAGAPRLLDLNLRPPHTPDRAVDAALACASVVKLSQEEADALGQRFGVADAALHLLERHDIQLVALTRGAQGSRLYAPDGPHEHAGCPLEPDAPADRDPVGAGDAFTAALAHHLVRGTPPGPTADAANRYAAFVASRAGATPKIPAALRGQVSATTAKESP